MENTTLLQMKGISKEFPGVKALDDVHFDLKAGEVHALLGENGAGKSTLIKVLGGIYHPEAGEILIDGQVAKITSVKEAQDAGIAIIHQELVLVPYMTIAENIFLGKEPKKGGLVDFKTMNESAQAYLDQFGINLDAKIQVGKLTIGQQQMVEIIKAISANSRILVMDEPTSSISEKEVDFLFSIMRKLTQQGVGIIYISHKMSELQEICDRVTVMRDGKTVATKEVATTSNDTLINLMVGRELDNYYTRTYGNERDVKLEVKNISDGDLVKDVSFFVKAGEVVGFSGLIGAGRSETMKVIFGLSEKTAGEVLINGQAVEIKSPVDAMKYGIGLVPEERKKDGLYLIQNVRFNTTIEVLKEFMTGLRVDHNKEAGITQRYIDLMRTKTPSQEQEVGKLSGGNQQKVLIGRWLATNPEILILDEPTRGVDVGAKSEIYAIINDLVKEGMAVIIVSSELPEILNMSDRIYVMKDGEIMGCFDHKEATQEKIMSLAAR